MGMDEQSSRLPSLAELRRAAAWQGVFPTDEDLQAVLDFLEAVLPALADIERLLPADLAPAGIGKEEGEV